MPHLSLPLAVAPNGRLAGHVDDAPTAVVQSLALLLDTRPGERRSAVEYGLPDHLFTTTGIDPAIVAGVAAEWEERATPVDVETAHHAYEQHLRVHPSEETT